MNPGRRTLHALLMVCCVTLLGSGCSTMVQRDVKGHVPLNKAVREVPEEQLLDVWIEVFDPGSLPEDPDDALGLSMDIRDAEARFFPEQLRATMERTGHWGAVRLVPQDTAGGEVLVRGTIMESDGEQLVLRITALDATGRQWFRRSYEAEVLPMVYHARGEPGREAFQSLYNTIANDLAVFRQSSFEAQDVQAIRRVAELRFAADIAPAAFNGYLEENDGHYTVVHLPAEDDPMYRRVRAIRERDFLLIDTLNGHYDNFTRQLETPYDEWRKARSEEAAALRAVEREALTRKLLGAAAIIGAVVLDSNSDSSSSAVVRDAMILGGMYAVKTGFDKDSETTIHREVIEELDESFSSEARPMVVEVEGETHQLTGSAEVQYAKWRALLQQIYASETGLPVTSN